jgi:hypothetical protein
VVDAPAAHRWYARDEGGSARAPLDVTVHPSRVMTFPPNEAAQYVVNTGSSSRVRRGSDGKVSSFTISYEDNTLKVTPDNSYMKKFSEVRISPDRFAAGIYNVTETFTRC